MPLLSVIMPVYNVEEYLEDAVTSILEQKAIDFELIIVDDGSTDSSGEIAEKFSQNSNVQIIHTRNGGLSEARNMGLKKASGEYLFFFDSDDLVVPNFFEILAPYLNNKIDLVTFGYKEIASSGHCNDFKSAKVISSQEINGNEAILELLQGDIYQMAWSYVVRKSIFENNGIYFSKGRLFEDNNSAGKIFINAKRVVKLKTEPELYLLRSRTDSITAIAESRHSYREFLDEIFVFNDLYNVIKPINLKIDCYGDYWYFNKNVHLYNKYYESLKNTKNEEDLVKLKTQIKSMFIHREVQLKLRDRIRYYRTQYVLLDMFIRFIYKMVRLIR